MRKLIAATLTVAATLTGLWYAGAPAASQPTGQIENGWNSDEYVSESFVTCDSRTPQWAILLTRMDKEARKQGFQTYVLAGYPEGGGSLEVVDKVEITAVGLIGRLYAPEPMEPGSQTLYWIFQNNGLPHDREAVSEERIRLEDC